MNNNLNDNNVPPTNQYEGGVLSTLAKIYSTPSNNAFNMRNWPQDSNSDKALSSNDFYEGRRGMRKSLSSASLADTASTKVSSKIEVSEIDFNGESKITIQIAEVHARQDYILKLCHALMAFGAPTHRLEENLIMSARILEVQASFLYIPGCMIVSFDNITTRTNEVKLVKVSQGVSLGLLEDIHKIYKAVMHNQIGVEDATQLLDNINKGPPVYSPWLVVLFYGFASAFVSPWAFQGRFIDMPVCFALGCIVGILQNIVAPKGEVYNNLFEIAATIITSFLARAVGSLQNGSLFCFSALAQSALALMLPGYIVLCGCLELQSKSLVAGGVRVVYGLIIAFFLSFGISIGTALYGILDPNATNATTCENVLVDHQKWIFVPFFALFAGLANQARLKQAPVMMVIGFAGYIVNFLAHKQYPSSAQISNTLAGFTVGLLGNLLSRLQQGVSAAALLPPLLVLVPSGIAASGSLISGLHSADAILNGDSIINGTSLVPVSPNEDLTKIVASVLNTMIQLAVGLTVGLFSSTLLVYPFGKKRSGLFTY